MSLQRPSFDRVASGSKTVECRLYDEKRRAVKVGDRIVFKCLSSGEPGESVTMRVTEIARYPDFESMVAEIPPGSFGHASASDVLKEMGQFYSLDDQRRNGVVGMRIERV